jgi:hypothetical protein
LSSTPPLAINKKAQSIPALLVLPAVTGAFAYVVAGELDAHVITQALIPTLYGACGDGFDAFDAEYISASFGQAADEVHGLLGDNLLGPDEKLIYFLI